MTTEEPAQRACPDWLDLRAEVDTRARDAGAGELLVALVDAVGGSQDGGEGHAGTGRGAQDRTDGSSPGRGPTVRIVDVGAGTGANRRYLSPRLPFDQEWVAVDHDAELLAHPAHDGSLRVRGSVQDLPQVLASLPGGTGASGGRDVRQRREGADGQDGPEPHRGTVVPTVVVATAVLDVLTTQDLAALADAVALAGAGLLSLSVTGEVRWEPADPVDGLLSAAFDDHQRRDGRPGPDAPAVLTRLLRERGLQVRTAPTPWDLPGPDGRYRAVLERWLDERVDDAVERDPSSAAALRTWQQRRRDQLASGGLRVLVDHVDLLAVPAGGLGGPGGPGAVADGPHGAQPGA